MLKKSDKVLHWMSGLLDGVLMLSCLYIVMITISLTGPCHLEMNELREVQSPLLNWATLSTLVGPVPALVKTPPANNIPLKGLDGIHVQTNLYLDHKQLYLQ